jgi:hypothetical protein
MTAARKTRKRASSAKEAAPVHTRIETGSFDAQFRSLRLSRPDGATIVLNVPDVQGVEDYFARVRAWFDERPEELALFGLLDPYQQSKRDLIAFADQSQTKIPLAPPSKVELRLEIVNDIGPSRDSAPPPIVGSDYPVVASVSRRAISSFVLSATSDTAAFTTTERGIVFMHDDTQAVGAVGQVMLRPIGEAQSVMPSNGLRPEQIEEIRRSVPAWSPLDEDTLEIMLSHAATNVSDEDGFWTLYVDQMLDARRLKQKKRGGLAKAGYRADDRAETMRSIARLDSAWVRVYRCDDSVQIAGDEDFARVVLIAEVRSRSDRLARIRYRPGTWCDPGDTTALSPRKVLEYDPYREAAEKHLARYFLQRVGEAEEGILARTVSELCARGGIAIDRNNPKRTQRRFTQALDRLSVDGAIVQWTYADDPRELPSRGYLDAWLGFRVRVLLRSHEMRRYRVATPPEG